MGSRHLPAALPPLVLAAALLFTFASVAGRAETGPQPLIFTTIDHPDASGSFGTVAGDINNQGAIVGYYRALVSGRGFTADDRAGAELDDCRLESACRSTCAGHRRARQAADVRHDAATQRTLTIVGRHWHLAAAEQRQRFCDPLGGRGRRRQRDPDAGGDWRLRRGRLDGGDAHARNRRAGRACASRLRVLGMVIFDVVKPRCPASPRCPPIVLNRLNSETHGHPPSATWSRLPTSPVPRLPSSSRSSPAWRLPAAPLWCSRWWRCDRCRPEKSRCYAKIPNPGARMLSGSKRCLRLRNCGPQRTVMPPPILPDRTRSR